MMKKFAGNLQKNAPKCANFRASQLQWDVVCHLETEADVNAYLSAAHDDGDPILIAAVEADIVRAKAKNQ
jgi:DNA-binding phage protein